MQDLIEKDEFLEYAEVHGNFYGTSINQVNNEIELGRDVILEIDVQGAENILKNIARSRQYFYFAAVV